MNYIQTLYILFLVQFCFQFQITDGQQNLRFFRKDYTFLEDTQNFYKIHTIARTWKEAKKWCAIEGASLFHPVDQAEADSVIKFWNQTQPFYHIYVGVSSLLAKGVFENIEGISIMDLYNNWSPGEPNDVNGEEDCVVLRRDGTLNDYACNKKSPFICKKSQATLEWNLLCDMPNTDYVFSVEMGKCYKFHLTPMNWVNAYTVCSAEQSYLAVINSKAEANYLVNVTAHAPKDKYKGIYVNGEVYLGFHNRDGEGWTTVKGTSLEDSGYSQWAQQLPDGGEHETCGTMFFDGLLNDQHCAKKCFFICEHDIGTLTNLFIEKY